MRVDGFRLRFEESNENHWKLPNLIGGVEPFHTFSGFNRLLDAMFEPMSSTFFWNIVKG